MNELELAVRACRCGQQVFHKDTCMVTKLRNAHPQSSIGHYTDTRIGLSMWILRLDNGEELVYHDD